MWLPPDQRVLCSWCLVIMRITRGAMLRIIVCVLILPLTHACHAFAPVSCISHGNGGDLAEQNIACTIQYARFTTVTAYRVSACSALNRIVDHVRTTTDPFRFFRFLLYLSAATFLSSTWYELLRTYRHIHVVVATHCESLNMWTSAERGEKGRDRREGGRPDNGSRSGGPSFTEATGKR